MMRRDTAETIIRRALEESEQVTFSFQGGEPTLWGLDNFRFFAQTVDRLNASFKPIQYALQTNGILLNEDWAAFFKKNNFLVGLSLDGYKDLHDANRLDASGQGSYSRSLRAAALLRKAGVEFNILTVVTSNTARHVEKLYRFYQNQNLKYLQFIPCIDDFGSDGASLTANEYGRFLETLFDLWYRGLMEGHGISIRYFDNLLNIFRGYPPELCSMNGICHVQNVIESDGGVYPCDFYVLDHWRLGDVHTDSYESMLDSEIASKFIDESRHIWEECSRCRWVMLCRGGCKRDREPVLGGIPSPNRFCSAYKDFFSYSYDGFMELCGLFPR